MDQGWVPLLAVLTGRDHLVHINLAKSLLLANELCTARNLPHSTAMATSAPPIIYDEREELLREAAALGNAKALSFYLTAGVSPNAQNKINGWTPLHWAAQRSHVQLVNVLLRHGADPTIKNYKQQTPRDVASNADVLAALDRVLGADSDPAPAPAPAGAPLAITPNYLRDPDLLKTWSAPDELPAQLQPVVLHAPEPEAEAPAAPTLAASAPSTAPQSADLEILVHQKAADGSLDVLGAILVPPSTLIRDAVAQIKEELLDDADATIKSLGRIPPSSTKHIPVPPGQWAKYDAGRFFGSGEEMYIVLA
ncbi:Ankyrin repeat domain-containing protein 40 [Allomyces javanicus]|nr:Ankyrin repeat domain-containing protein 40 [Allomyces javanicus]